MALNHSPWFSQLSLASHHPPGLRAGQVREGEKAGESLEQWIPWIRANSRDVTQGPWLMSITEGITQMIISGSQK